MKAYEQTINLLDTLRLKGIINKIDEIINDAETQKVSYITFLYNLFNAEITDRARRRFEKNMSAAHFPVEKRINTFNFGRVKGIGKSESINIFDCRWIDRKENLLFFGPPGIGKTHTVCFEKITNLIRMLKVSEIQKTAEFRIRKILKSNVFIIDEIGYTPIERKEANMFFNLISELYEKSSIIITSNKSFDSWSEMMGDNVMTAALLDRLLHHAKIFNLDGESYRLKDKLK
jgi:DNA replication protein DnaC